MSETYTLTLTRHQAEVLSGACEAIARVGMGQISDALGYLTANRYDHDDLNDACRALESAARKYETAGIARAAHPSQIAWDLYQVIRQQLAWDRAIAEGIVKPGEPRKWPEMMAVTYDDPMRVSSEPLASIEPSEAP